MISEDICSTCLAGKTLRIRFLNRMGTSIQNALAKGIRILLSKVVTLMIVAVTTAFAPQSRTVAERPSVAGYIVPATAVDSRPLAVIDRTDIELSGMNNVWDLLQGRLRFNSFGIHRAFIHGSGYSAVLVNGRRISDSTFDMAALPIAAVERIEILSDSAAALHGGHAIGGAVNIVLRREHKGVEVVGSAARPNQKGGDSEYGSVLWGGALGRGHVTVGVDIFRREEIRDADRAYSRASWIPGGSFADASGVSVGGNTVFIGVDDGTLARSLGNCEGSAYVRGLTDPYGISGTGCGFAYADIKWQWERYERESLFLNLDHPLGEEAEMYFDIRVAWADTAFRFAPSVGTFTFTPSEPLRQSLLQDPEIGTLPEKLTVAHRFVSHGNRDWLTDLEEYDFTAGLQGRFSNGIGYDAHLRYYRHDAVETGNTFVSESAIQGAIDEERYNLENPLSMDPVHLATVSETGLQLTRDQLTDHKTARASLEGTAFALGGGDMRWVAGAEIADEDWRDIYEYRDSKNGSYDAADVLGSAGNSASGRRQRESLFTEMSLPLTSDWEFILAARRDNHDDVGATFSHQVASRYRLNEALAIRGSWSGGSRAPSLYLLHHRESLSYPYICDRTTHSGDLEGCDRYQVERSTAGNPNLKPNKAESYSLGAAMSLDPLTLSVDWFQIGISDQPTRLTAQTAIDLEAEGLLPPGVMVIRDGDLITRIKSPWVGSGETDISGLALRARANWETDWADVVFDARWSRVTDYEHRVAGEIQPGDYPRNRVHVSARASRAAVTVNWSIHAVSGYSNVLETGRYEKWIGHDITLRWRDAFGVSGLDLIGGVLNVGDRGPSIDPTNPDAPDLSLDSALGRTLFVTAKFSFGS